MALKKPSDLLDKKETSGVFETPEVTPHITESYNKFVDNFDKVNELSEKVEFLSKELSEKLTRTDLENAMLSQLMVLDENFKNIQSQVKGLNKEDLREFKSTVSNLSQVVNNFLETELPKYKNQLVKSKVFVGEQVQQLQGIVEENITGIREEIDEKFDNIAEVIDNNLEYFNNQLQETSSKVKKTVDTYNKISKIVENKVSKENEKLEEYSQVIESLTQSFEELSYALKKELDVTSQLSEEKFEEYKTQFENISTGLEKSVDNRLDNYRKELVDVKAEVAINEQHIKNVDKYLQEHYQDIVDLKEEVFTEIEKLPVGNIQENIKRLEKKIDYIKETYSKIEPEVIVKEVIKEGLLNEPPETTNSDPLTPLNQNFVTLDQLQQHYRLFINRIQQQIATIGGGGETRLQYLDDIVGIATNPSAYDGKYLKYNHSIGKFEFVTVVGGGGGGSQSLNDVLGVGNTSDYGLSVGVSTITELNVTNKLHVVGMGVSPPPTEEFYVNGRIALDGDVRITGILTVGGSSITLDGLNNEIKVGTGLTITEDGNANYSGIITASSFVGNVTGTATTAATVDIMNTNGLSNVFYPTFVEFRDNGQILRGDVDLTYRTDDNILTVPNVSATTFTGALIGNATSATYATTAGVSTYATTAGVSTTSGYATNAEIATYATTAGVSTYASTAGYATSAGIATVSRGLTGIPNIIVNTITASGAYFGGNVSIAGTLSYESLTYIDSVGVITARNGILIGPPTSIGATISSYGDAAFSGIITAASFSGNATSATTAATANVANYATSSGIATYATTAGVSTNAQGLTGTPNISVGILTATSAVIGSAVTITSGGLRTSGIVTASSFRPSSGYIQAADGTNSFYIYSGTGNVAFQGTIGASQINSAQGYKVIGFAGTNNATFENNVYISGITTSVGGFVGNLTGNASSATYATTSGLSTYSTSSGIATYATTSGVSTTAGYATTAGIATYATSSGISTYSTTAGIATYATSSGISTYATTAGVSTYSTSSGIATYATTAGISTVSQGLTGTPNLNVGVVTATSFNGSGTSLTGIVTSIVAGTNITISGSTGQVTINATGGGGGGVTSIIAGSGISIDQSTGNVTITATGGGAGGTNLGLVLASTYNMLMP